MKFKRQYGVWYVRIGPGPGKYKYVSTGEADLEKAKEIADLAFVEKMDKLSKARSLSERAFVSLTNTSKMTVQGMLDDYLKWMSKARSPARLHCMRVTLCMWVRETGMGKRKIGKVTREDIFEWINNNPKIKRKKLSTRLEYLTRLKLFFKWCIKENAIRHNPTDNVYIDTTTMRMDRKETKVRPPFTDDEVWKIANSVDGFWRIAVIMSRYLGLRMSDIARLEWESFAVPGRIIVWTAKARKRFSVEMPKEVMEVIGEIDFEDSVYCFPRERLWSKDPELSAMMSQEFAKIIKRAGVEPRGRTFHSLRCTFAVEMRNRGIDLPHISTALCHSNEYTTRIYTNAMHSTQLHHPMPDDNQIEAEAGAVEDVSSEEEEEPASV